jgi:hypothetical protein
MSGACEATQLIELEPLPRLLARAAVQMVDNTLLMVEKNAAEN